MVKFLTNSDLLFLVDFGPDALSAIPETWNIDLQSIIDKLKQFPSYQVDKNHTKCGIRTRIMPILGVLEQLVCQDVLAVPLVNWQRRHGRNSLSWMYAAHAKQEDRTRDGRFQWSRKYAGLAESSSFGSMDLALSILTATAWNWIDPDEMR